MIARAAAVPAPVVWTLLDRKPVTDALELLRLLRDHAAVLAAEHGALRVEPEVPMFRLSVAGYFGMHDVVTALDGGSCAECGAPAMPTSVIFDGDRADVEVICLDCGRFTHGRLTGDRTRSLRAAMAPAQVPWPMTLAQLTDGREGWYFGGISGTLRLALVQVAPEAMALLLPAAADPPLDVPDEEDEEGDVPPAPPVTPCLVDRIMDRVVPVIATCFPWVLLLLLLDFLVRAAGR